jgi:hypothetical protein
MSAPAYLELHTDPERVREWNAAGKTLRERNPILGKTATDADCKKRSKAHAELMRAWGIDQDATRHVWHTAVLSDGRVCGQWSDSIESAAVSIATWWEQDVVAIIEDAECLIHAKLKADQKADAKLQAKIDAHNERLRAEYVDESTPTGGLLDLL